MRRGRVSDYATERPAPASWLANPSGTFPHDVALPCVAQGETAMSGAFRASSNGVSWCEGAVCATLLTQSRVQAAGVATPSRSLNAGGGHLRRLEMQQNSSRTRGPSRPTRSSPDHGRRPCTSTVYHRRRIRCGWRLRGWRELAGFRKVADGWFAMGLIWSDLLSVPRLAASGHCLDLARSAKRPTPTTPSRPW